MLILLLILFILYFYLIMPRRSEAKRMDAFHHTMFAHRGYHCADKNIPENSMAAFRAAIEHGYGIELDLHLSKDGQLVVFHDDTLSRMCGHPGIIEHMTFSELQKLSLLNTSEKIPLFTDVLALVDGRVPLLIELKVPKRSLQICEKTDAILKTYRGNYLVQSFNTMALHWFRLHSPETLRGQLSSRLTKKNTPEHWILKFMVENLLANFLGRPDFISYKLADLPKFPVTLLRFLFRVPVAVWTLRTREALKEGVIHYNIQIFEKHGENY